MDMNSDEDRCMKAAAEGGRWKRVDSADAILVHEFKPTQEFLKIQESNGTQEWMMTSPAMFYIRDTLKWRGKFPIGQVNRPFRVDASGVKVSFLPGFGKKKQWTSDRMFQLSYLAPTYDRMREALKDQYSKLDLSRAVFPSDRLETGMNVVVVLGPSDIERARVVGVTWKSKEALVDLYDLGTRSTVPLESLTFLFQMFWLPPRAITFKMKGISPVQRFPVCQKYLTPASGIWQGQLIACKTEKDDKDWTIFSAMITQEARPSGINDLIVERVMEEVRKTTHLKIGEVFRAKLPKASIPFGPISKEWSKEEIKGFTRDQFIPFRILEVEGNKARVRPDCFTTSIQNMEKALMEDFGGWKTLDGVEPLVRTGESYMVISAGKVHRAIAVKSRRSERGAMCPMFLVDHARVEVVKMTNVKPLPQCFRDLIYSALVACLVPVAVARSNGVTLNAGRRAAPWVKGELVFGVVGKLLDQQQALSPTVIGPHRVQLLVKDAARPPRRRR